MHTNVETQTHSVQDLNQMTSSPKWLRFNNLSEDKQLFRVTVSLVWMTWRPRSAETSFSKTLNPNEMMSDDTGNAGPPLFGFPDPG